MNRYQLNIDQVVYLRSGGPPMKARRLERMVGRWELLCTWLDDKGAHVSGYFAFESLTNDRPT